MGGKLQPSRIIAKRFKKKSRSRSEKKRKRSFSSKSTNSKSTPRFRTGFKFTLPEIQDTESRSLVLVQNTTQAAGGDAVIDKQEIVASTTAPEVQPPAKDPIVVAPEQKIEGFSIRDLIRPAAEVKRSIEAFLKDQRSEHTQRAYGKDMKRFLKFLLVREFQNGDERLDRTIIIAYKDWLLGEKMEHTSVDRHLATLRSLFRWLVEDGHLEKNPAAGVRFMKPKRMSTTIGFSDEEVKKVLQKPNLHTRTGAQHYAILMILFYCGLRRSELCEIKVNQLVEERGHHILKLTGKGNKERIIPLIKPVWNAIRYFMYINKRDFLERGYLFKPLKNNRTGDLNKALDSTYIYYIVKKYAAAAGIMNRVSPHSCRATAISNARDHNVADRAIQEFAGWSSTDMITRYDKRKTAIEDSAAHSIKYAEDERELPEMEEFPAESSNSNEKRDGFPELDRPI